MSVQKVLSFLPGYMWNGEDIVSTGVAIPPTRHKSPDGTGEIYYVRPMFEFGPTIGMYIKREGLIKYIYGDPSS